MFYIFSYDCFELFSQKRKIIFLLSMEAAEGFETFVDFMTSPVQNLSRIDISLGCLTYWAFERWNSFESAPGNTWKTNETDHMSS